MSHFFDAYKNAKQQSASALANQLAAPSTMQAGSIRSISQPPFSAVPAAEPFGHSDDEIKAARKSLQYFYVWVSEPPDAHAIPTLSVQTFRLAEGASCGARVPPAFYATRADADAAVARLVQARVVALFEVLVADLTAYALNNGVLGTPELDVTQAMRTYLAAVKP